MPLCWGLLRSTNKKDFLGAPVVMTLPSDVGVGVCAGSIPH